MNHLFLYFSFIVYLYCCDYNRALRERKVMRSGFYGFLIKLRNRHNSLLSIMPLNFFLLTSTTARISVSFIRSIRPPNGTCVLCRRIYTCTSYSVVPANRKAISIILVLLFISLPNSQLSSYSYRTEFT